MAHLVRVSKRVKTCPASLEDGCLDYLIKWSYICQARTKSQLAKAAFFNANFSQTKMGFCLFLRQRFFFFFWRLTPGACWLPSQDFNLSLASPIHYSVGLTVNEAASIFPFRIGRESGEQLATLLCCAASLPTRAGCKGKCNLLVTLNEALI